MGKELDLKRFQFFTRCIESLKTQLPRNYKVPALKDNNCWQLIYGPTDDKIYFEWNFRRADFTVNLNFETKDSKENRKLLNRFRPIQGRLESNLKTKVVFDD